jgi:hypothetical protein
LNSDFSLSFGSSWLDDHYSLSGVDFRILQVLVVAMEFNMFE